MLGLFKYNVDTHFDLFTSAAQTQHSLTERADGVKNKLDPPLFKGLKV